MPSKIPAQIREAVEKRAENVCEYCLLPGISAHFKHQVDHILPRKHGGQTVLENLALACWRCNLHKGTDVGSFDFETNDEFARFFNPRAQSWEEHFRIENAEIIPLTAEARVTVRIFRLNDEERREERRGLIAAGFY
jgi:hypothetical protein